MGLSDTQIHNFAVHENTSKILEKSAQLRPIHLGMLESDVLESACRKPPSDAQWTTDVARQTAELGRWLPPLL